MYTIKVKYENTNDRTEAEAGREGYSIEELCYDIIFFLGKSEYLNKFNNEKDKIKIKNITINFNK